MALAFAVLLLYGFRQYQYSHAVFREHQKFSTVLESYPLKGIAEYDTHGAIPGNLNNGVADLRAIYKSISIYRDRHNGECPRGTNALMNDMSAALGDYGLNNDEQVKQIFVNPDAVYADFPGMRNSKDDIVYTIPAVRYDGTKIGGPRPDDKRDALAWTDLYVHENTRRYGPENVKSSPVGYYLVLWEDGKVEKIAHDKAIHVPVGRSDVMLGFSGQAGIHDFITDKELHHPTARVMEILRNHR